MRPSPDGRVLALSAAVWLILVRAALWLLPFRVVRRGLLPLTRARSLPAAPGQADVVALAVNRASQVVPGSTCLSRALAAQVLLGRAGIESTLRLGVAVAEGRDFEAHAWLEDGSGRILVGEEEAGGFTALPPLDRPALAVPSPAASPEMELVLACAASAGSWPGERDAVGNAALDWDEVRALAVRHRILPLVWSAVRAAPDGDVPEAVKDRLRADFEALAARSLELTAELVCVLGALEAVGISALPYKGAVLAWQLYGNVAMRTFKDNDLVIRLDDLPTARLVLSALGYVDLHPSNRAAWNVNLRSNHELTMIKAGLVVELHWSIAPAQFAVPLVIAELFQRARPEQFAGREILLLAPEDLLLMLCVHGAKDRWQWLDNVCSVHELLRRNPDLDWGRIELAATAMGTHWILLLGLALAADLLGADVPQTVLSGVSAAPAPARLAAEAAAAIRHGDPPQTSRAGLSQLRFHLAARERFADRVRYCARAALTPNVMDVEALQLPDRLAFLYYPVHLVRVAARYSPLSRRRGATRGA